MFKDGWITPRFLLSLWPALLIVGLIIGGAVVGIVVGLASLPPEERGSRLLAMGGGIVAGVMLAMLRR